MYARARVIADETGVQDTAQPSGTRPARRLTEAQMRVLAFISDRSFGWATPIYMVQASPLLEKGDVDTIPSLIADALLERVEGIHAVRITDEGKAALTDGRNLPVRGRPAS